MSGLSRRALLYGGGLAALAGVGLGGVDRLSGPRFREGYTTHRLERPVVAGGPTPDAGPTFFARTITSREQARAAFRTEVLDDRDREEWESVDYGSSFVVAFLARVFVTPPGTMRGDRPLGSASGDTFEYEVRTDDVDFRYRDRLFTRVERWERGLGSPPEKAEVVLRSG